MSTLATYLPVFTYRIGEGVLEASEGGSWRGLWAGRGTGLNNPAACAEHAVGPLPPGLYTVGRPVAHPRLGPVAMPLTPCAETDTWHRAGFYIHGASRTNPGESSHGCIIAPRGLREHIAAVCAALPAEARILRVTP